MNFDSDYTMTIGSKAVTVDHTCPVINPATEEEFAQAPEAAKVHLNEAVAAAKAAFPVWSSLDFSKRQEYIRKIGECIEKYKDELMALLTREQGKSRGGSDWEITGSIYWCQEVAKQEMPIEIVEDSAERTIEMRYTPVGVVGAITPWNYPVLLALWKILPALLAGNTMVVKPSPYTPLTTLKLGEMLRDVLPKGVLNIISGGNDLGEWLSTHPDIGKVSFTGSTDTGKKVMQSASATLKKVTLELGGNDAAIVMPDVDPKKVAPELFWAAFQNSAQLCVAAKRVYIHADIYDQVAHEMVEYAKTIRVGDGSLDGVDLGPVQNKMQFEKVKNLLQGAKDDGNKFLIGGSVECGKGYFVPVTIVDNPPENSRVVVEEAFGPVLPLLKFNDEEEVIRRANDSIYGLGGSVWCRDIEKAKSIAEQLETGTVWINEIHIFSPHAAFSGHKQSGIGVEHAVQGLLEFTNTQTVISKKAINAA